MTHPVGTLRGDFNDFPYHGGPALLPRARVTYPVLRVDTENAVLLFDDSAGNIAPFASPGSFFSQGALSLRIQTNDGMKHINVERGPYSLPAIIEMELSDFGGDFTVFNGHWACLQVLTGAHWRADLTGFAPITKLSLDRRLHWTGNRWQIELQTALSCRQIWRGGGQVTDPSVLDPEGAYANRTLCSNLGCTDPTTCALSAGATCRVRWAGATWL